MSMKNGNWNIYISKTTTYLYMQSELFLSGRCAEIMFVNLTGHNTFYPQTCLNLALAKLNKSTSSHIWIDTVGCVGDMVVTQMLPSGVRKPKPSTQHVMRQSGNALERLKPLHWKKSAICISCHQAWSSFRPADRDIGSHSVTSQCTQRATIQDVQIKNLQTRVCPSSVCWWGTRRPLLLLLYRHCVPFQSPLPSWFPLLLARIALQQPVGFPQYRSWGFLHLKVSDVAQRLPVPGTFYSFVGKHEKLQCISLCQKCGGHVWIRNWRLELIVSQSDVQSNGMGRCSHFGKV